MLYNNTISLIPIYTYTHYIYIIHTIPYSVDNLELIHLLYKLKLKNSLIN